jgi:hypothetical protein
MASGPLVRTAPGGVVMSMGAVLLMGLLLIKLSYEQYSGQSLFIGDHCRL